ncbi:YiiG family protein [Pseudomonas koreensis]|uniref:YiiG family protein n=1 Tax=Pseudomonas koreensis TaxID=198620 RepID=UPI0021C726A7|nr:YiiG family protein [Pseudomonas koreensis]MCU0070280.1 YiiG family protein [Pseudomonas koreensis]
MSSKMLFPIGLVIALVVMGLTGATRPFLQFDLWLDELDSPITAQTNALSPLITCVNRVDVQWRVAYDRYKNPQPPEPRTPQWFLSLKAFDDSDAFTVQDIQRDVCSPGITQKLEILKFQPMLAQKADAYVRTLQYVTTVVPPTRYYREASFLSSSQQPSMEESATIKRAAEEYDSASTALRQALLPLDAAQRPEQLKRLEARMGKDIHWYLLAYMIQARETVDVLDQAMKNRTLTPQLLADTTAKLQQAWDRREPFLAAPYTAFQSKTDAARGLWLHIGVPGTEYLEALNTLQKDWQNHAEPQRLSDDFHAVTRSYDGLLSHYNRRARAEF